APLRFGIDPGVAGSAGGAQLPATPDDLNRDVSRAQALRPAGRVLVVRLNRLFWSDGEAGIAHFKALVAKYAAAGLAVELQVRYHPGPGEDGNLAAWRAYVRHVVDVFGSDPRVVAMTITNEVNVTFSSNTSDGAYTNAKDALIQGIVAAHSEAVRKRFDRLRFGFTYAYRFSPSGDASFFAYLGAHGGSAFRAALGFVGLDFYPGSVYPPTMSPGETYRGDMAQALGAVRGCYMPMAQLGSGIPIWITENGVPTGANTNEAQQASALTQLVDAARAYSGTFNVTDYRWFNLRDANESPTGSLPGASATFATDGLLHDDYSAKPAYAAYRAAIAALGAGLPKLRYAQGCRSRRVTIGLRRERRAVRQARVFLGHRRLAAAHGHHLRRIRVRRPTPKAFSLRFVLRLSGGRTVRYHRRFYRNGCRVVPRRGSHPHHGRPRVS
ncbi:MAG: hypothetical protein M3016_10320, partial [Actinomycetota bacterium]|nr:hypothetical protein [Actinomycetota bacterium]